MAIMKPRETAVQAEARLKGRIDHTQAISDRSPSNPLLQEDVLRAKRTLADFYACWDPARVIDGWQGRTDTTSKVSRVL